MKVANVFRKGLKIPNILKIILEYNIRVSRYKLKRTIFVLTIFSALLPYFGILRLPSDIQPYYMLFPVVGIMLDLGKYRSISVYSIPFFIMLLVATTSFLFTLFRIPQGEIFTLVRFYFPYVSIPVFITYLFKESNRFEKLSIVKIADIALIFVVVSLLFNLLGLSSINSLFTNRAHYDFAYTSRGLVGIFAEQSHVAIHMSVFFMVYLFCGALNFKRASILFIASVSSLVGQVFIEFVVITMAVGLGYLFKVLFTTKISLRVLIGSFAGLILAAIGFQILLNQDIGNVRVVNLLIRASENLPYLIGSDGSIIFKISGVMLTISTVIGDLTNFQLGSAQFSNIYDRLEGVNHDIHMAIFGVSNTVYPAQTYSAFGTWIVDFGIIGLISYLILIFILVDKFLKHSKRPVFLMVMIYLLYISIVKAPLSNPSIFLLFCLLLSNRNLKFEKRGLFDHEGPTVYKRTPEK